MHQLPTVKPNTYLSAAVTKLEEQSALKSGSDFSKKKSSSFTMDRMLLPLTNAKHSSMDRLEIAKISTTFSKKLQTDLLQTKFLSVPDKTIFIQCTFL